LGFGKDLARFRLALAHEDRREERERERERERECEERGKW